MLDRDRCYYDANFAVNQHRGMGKYINNFIGVLKAKCDLSPIGLLRSGIKWDRPDFHVFGFANYVLWEQVSLLFFSVRTKTQIFFPYNTAPLFISRKPKNVLFIHDLIYMENYETKSFVQRIGVIYRRFVVPRIIDKFEHIVTVSNHSKAEILKNFDIDPQKVTVIPNSISYDQLSLEHNTKLHDREKFLLHIGGEPEYKNSKSLLWSFSLLPLEVKRNYKVKIIGIRDPRILADYKRLAAELDITEAIEFLSYQTDEEIIALFLKAAMFVFPSFYEGFGIPIIEAFKYGCPVLCSATSCFPEIAGEGALFFDPHNHETIKNAILMVMDDHVRTENRVLAGYEKLKQYAHQEFERQVIFWYQSKFGKEKLI